MINPEEEKRLINKEILVISIAIFIYLLIGFWFASNIPTSPAGHNTLLELIIFGLTWPRILVLAI